MPRTQNNINQSKIQSCRTECQHVNHPEASEEAKHSTPSLLYKKVSILSVRRPQTKQKFALGYRKKVSVEVRAHNQEKLSIPRRASRRKLIAPEGSLEEPSSLCLSTRKATRGGAGPWYSRPEAETPRSLTLNRVHCPERGEARRWKTTPDHRRHSPRTIRRLNYGTPGRLLCVSDSRSGNQTLVSEPPFVGCLIINGALRSVDSKLVRCAGRVILLRRKVICICRGFASVR